MNPINIIFRQFRVAPLLFITLSSGCLTAGTHGSIKGYQYNTSKYNLEKAVETVLASSRNIQRDSNKAYDDSTKNDYYNDGSSYLTITIEKDKYVNDYIFRYYGDKQYWDTSDISNIFICYAWDKDSKGGSEGDGGFPWYRFNFKNEMVSVFESEFVNKVDSVLKIKHIDTE